MKSYRCDDWSRLATGVNVEIHRRGRLFRAGVVETVMPDATMLWLSADHNGALLLFESAEGYEVWLDPDDLPHEPLQLPQHQLTTAPPPDTKGTDDLNPPKEGEPPCLQLPQGSPSALRTPHQETGNLNSPVPG